MRLCVMITRYDISGTTSTATTQLKSGGYLSQRVDATISFDELFVPSSAPQSNDRIVYDVQFSFVGSIFDKRKIC